MAEVSRSRDIFLETLEDLLAAINSNVDRANLIADRIEELRSKVANGIPIDEALTHEPSPLIVELITESIASLQQVGARLRWAEASILRGEGMTAADIARLFGVSRQRVSALLNNPPVTVGNPSSDRP